ncbi:MAG: L-threonylcarbamoyladenylate synthase [Lachnospiraceae bacterium]|nr:L-threonylcarbamoyladenylate synthase [Lachnospiraceae bacterium]
MKTKIVVVDESEMDEAAEKAIAEAGAILKDGGLVAFPTETVYGLGGDALNPQSSGKIYAAKGRPSDNPLIVHITNMKALEKIVKEIPETGKKLADAFWPGPLTMIFQKSDIVPEETTGGLETVAVRMPSHRIARALIDAAGGYVAAPSANISGKPSPTLAKYVAEDMMGRIEMILDGGSIGIGLESTIVDLTDGEPTILRPGYITEEMLTQVLGSVAVDRTILDGNSRQAPKAPGMKYRHYAPKGDLTIIDGAPEAVRTQINRLAQQQKEKGEKVGIIGTKENIRYYKADSIKSVGSREDEESIAKTLYQFLREFDDEEVTVIYSEGFSTAGIGQAIMNRLLKAAGHKIIYLDE